MAWIAKMAVAWLLALGGIAMVGGLRDGRRGLRASLEGILGLGLVVGLPMLLFAFVIALPLALLVAHNLPPLTGAFVYPFLVVGVVWVISMPLFPRDWQGARHAMLLFALFLGVGWSVVNHVFPQG